MAMETRVERALVHLPELMEEVRDVTGEVRDVMGDVREELRANRQERAEMREFMRELRDDSRRTTELVVARLDDMGDQIRANTAATWAMLDRFKNGPAAA
jgi:Sec-independent protein translocase protein TatA